MQRTKTYFTEEVFLLSTFSEFVKCWKSSKKSRLLIDSVNGKDCMNFSVFLGNPSDIHSKSNPRQRKPSPKEKKQRKKSAKKIQRDNERAAKFQEKRRQEEAASKAASGVPPPATSSPAASTVRAASVNFSFSSPTPEDVSNGTMEGISDPQPSPENLRQQQEDISSMTLSNDTDVVREDFTEPRLVLPEDKETAYEETESPGLDSDDDTGSKSRIIPEETNEDLDDDLTMTWPARKELTPIEELTSSGFNKDFYQKAYREASLAAKQWQIPLADGILQSNWYKENWDKIVVGDVSQIKAHVVQTKMRENENRNFDYFNNRLKLEQDARFSLEEIDSLEEEQCEISNEELNKEFKQFKQWIAGKRFEYFLENCKKPKPYIGKDQREPCNSPHMGACICE